jgi:pyruvate/2-oxoglutarate/acetoin dehydrogenase E1 component
MTRELKYSEAIREATRELLAHDRNVVLAGLGVPGPTGIFGTTSGLQQEFGAERVIDIPSSENGMTGVMIGAAIQGKRPIFVNMRVDFAVLAMEPLVNQAAKWHYMYGGVMRAPITVRMIVGRGWGQGPQHSQALQAWFAHVPGLKVVMPARPYDAKGMLVAAVEDDAPVIVFEHRWLYNLSGPVPEGLYRTSLDRAEVVRAGKDVTIVAASYMVIEAMRAAEKLAKVGVEAEVIDLRTLTPIDGDTICASVRKTGHLVVADIGYEQFGTVPEVISRVTQGAFGALKAAPRVVALPHVPTPTTPALADLFYPTHATIEHEVLELKGLKRLEAEIPTDPGLARRWHDTPDPTFTGPY